MFSDIASALGLLLSVTNILALFSGVAFGVILGAIPGLTGTMGIALVIPLTYSFDPITAFCILLGVYKGSLFGGSIPAILLNTPGSPAAAATVLDGHPMYSKGQGRKALKIALWSSVIGDSISTIVLILGAASLARFATRFGPAEFAMLVLFSLTIVAGVSGKSLTKGIIAVGLGFILGTVGLDPMMATPRFTFNTLTLMNGVSLMAVLIGLFAVSEVLIQIESKVTVPKLLKNSSQINILSPRDVFPYLKTIMRGALIGVGLGAIPGLGATPAAFLSYSEAKRTSKSPESFGQGNPEGVAAAESANNGTSGGALIPLLALGIPGDVTTAILFGAFLLHGLTPGPILFVENISLVYALFLALLIAGVFMLFFGALAIRVFSGIMRMPRELLYALVLLLCAMGVYGFQSSITDLWVMLGAGVLGFVMRKLDIPLAPLMIGFVLEPIGEQALRQTLMLSKGNWLALISSPISITLLVLTVIAIFLILRRIVVEDLTTNLHQGKSSS